MRRVKVKRLVLWVIQFHPGVSQGRFSGGRLCAVPGRVRVIQNFVDKNNSGCRRWRGWRTGYERGNWRGAAMNSGGSVAARSCDLKKQQNCNAYSEHARKPHTCLL